MPQNDDGTWPVHECIDWQRARSRDHGKPACLEERAADLAWKEARAEKLQLEVEHHRASVVSKVDHAAALAKRTAFFGPRARVRKLSRRVAPRLANCGAAEVQDVHDEEFDALLREAYEHGRGSCAG